MQDRAGELSVRREDRPTRGDGPVRRAPAAKAPGPRGRSPAAPVHRVSAASGAAWRLAQACLARPGAVVAVLALVGATGAVATNALTNQAGRHPAPLFGDARAPARVAASPALAPAAPRATPAAVAPPMPPARRDPIGELIRGDAVTTASTGAKADPDVRVAQRALSKLGYGSLKADGLMGTETRAALERFERDRKLPQTGQAAGRTLRALTLAATPAPATGDAVSNPKTID